MSNAEPVPGNALRQRGPSGIRAQPISTVAQNLEDKVERTLLLLWDEIPDWRRDNHFIRSGYRRSRASYRDSFRSLFYLHNESVNIWSHLVGAAFAICGALYLFRVVHPRYQSASAADVLVFACFFAGAVLCLGMSATYHTLVDHSPHVAKWGNKLDYTGIVALIVGSYVPTLYYGFFCRPKLMTAYLYLIFALGCGCGLVSWVERFRTPKWRPYRAMMFVGLGVSGVIPVMHGVQLYGWPGLEERMNVSWVMLHGAMYVLGAFLYAVRWPERQSPGAFDIWGSSHQIFHVFVVLAAGTHLYGLAKSFDHRHTVMGSHCALDGI